MNINIVTTPEEMEQVYRLRYKCYVEELGWKYDQADEVSKELRDPMDQYGTIFYAEHVGQMVATYCLHIGGDIPLPDKWRKHYALELFDHYPDSSFGFSSRLMVVPELRGSMVVPRMLMRAYEECLKRGTLFNFCYCRPRLIELYERLGFTRYKDNILEPTQGYMVPMVLLNRDAEHMKTVRSPFLRICANYQPNTETASWFEQRFPGIRASVTQQLSSPDEFWEKWESSMDASHVAVLQGMGVDQIRALLQAGTVLRCRAGDTIIREGEAGHEMFLILDGIARFSRRNENGSHSMVGMHGKGEIFGEMALVSRAKRHASVEAVTDMQVLVISQEFLRRAMKSMPEIAIRLLYNLCNVLSQKVAAVTENWQSSLQELRKFAVLASGQARLDNPEEVLSMSIDKPDPKTQTFDQRLAEMVTMKMSKIPNLSQDG